MSRIFPHLYTQDTLGNTRIWYMEQEGNSFRTVSGLEDGEKVKSEWTVALAKNTSKKNGTTAEEQATKEIEARYKKQLKTGYFDNRDDIGKMTFVEPMLAKKYADYRDKIDLSNREWLLQCKFNGMRCVATKDGLFTRKGEKYVSCPHIHESLKQFFIDYPNAVLDGELFNNDLRQQLNEISKLIRRTVHITQEDLDNSEKMVRFYVYDGYGFGMDKNIPYYNRKQWIDLNIVHVYNYIEQVLDHDVNSQDAFDEIYLSLVEDGHEGGILRNKKMHYEHKRSKNLLKVKPEDDAEAVITGIYEGVGNWAGAGKIIGLKWQGNEFNATFKGTYEQSVQFLKDKDLWIDKTVTFLYNGLTGKGIPNFARVDINNCVKG
jgi:DNA ligase-1